MSERTAERLGQYIQRQRLAKGWSIRGLASAAAVDASGLAKLEKGRFQASDPVYLGKLARALGVAPSELYLAAGFAGADQLPGFAPYLRAKYDLPEEAVEQLAAFFDFVNAKHQREASRQGGSHGRRRP